MTNRRELHRGALDYCEFIIDPDNVNSTPEQIIDCFQAYFTELGMSRIESRAWVLGRLKELRESRSKELEKKLLK